MSQVFYVLFFLFFYFLDCIFFTVYFNHNFFFFDEVQFIYFFPFVVWTFGVISKKLLPNLRS